MNKSLEKNNYPSTMTMQNDINALDASARAVVSLVRSAGSARGFKAKQIRRKYIDCLSR